MKQVSLSMQSSSLLCAAAAITLCVCTPAPGQTKRVYQVTVPGTDLKSRAERTDSELVIVDQQEQTTRYLRDKSFDTADGNWFGYRSTAARQLNRWPRDERGQMMIAAWNGGTGRADFRTSRMKIVAIK